MYKTNISRDFLSKACFSKAAVFAKALPLLLQQQEFQMLFLYHCFITGPFKRYITQNYRILKLFVSRQLKILQKHKKDGAVTLCLPLPRKSNVTFEWSFTY